MAYFPPSPRILGHAYSPFARSSFEKRGVIPFFPFRFPLGILFLPPSLFSFSLEPEMFFFLCFRGQRDLFPALGFPFLTPYFPSFLKIEYPPFLLLSLKQPSR